MCQKTTCAASDVRMLATQLHSSRGHNTRRRESIVVEDISPLSLERRQGSSATYPAAVHVREGGRSAGVAPIAGEDAEQLWRHEIGRSSHLHETMSEGYVVGSYNHPSHAPT
eukprot:scaffold28_cov515-Prasinococcus_capsulatus_cf.AAC.2